MTSITTPDVRAWVAHLKKMDNGRGGKLSAKTITDHLSSLSNLFRRARSEGCAPPGFNPVGDLMDRPSPKRKEAEWLEVHDAALFLEAARTYAPPKDKHGIPGRQMHAMLATFLLTGGRKSEVLGLEVEDVSFDRKRVTFRPNERRRLKTRSSRRSVPLWPQLEEILREYVFGGSGPPPDGLLFPSPRTYGIISDTRKALDTIAERAKLGETVRLHKLRHTYATARLQTVDGGQPVAMWTVAKELGHSSTRLIEERYGHLGEVRHRSEVVEFRVDQHREALGERLEALEALAAAT